MKKKHLTTSLAAITLIFSAIATGKTINTVDNIPFEYDQFTTENGLRVVIYPDKSKNSITMSLIYNVGSADEPKGKTGFAHLFEHLMFAPTPNRKEDYFTSAKEAGTLMANAFTNNDITHYFASFPKEALDYMLWLESDRMLYLPEAINKEMVDKEIEVVKNEKRQRGNTPYKNYMDSLRKTIYPIDHPYNHEIVGSMEDLDAATVDDVKNWFTTYYVASNAVLVLSGNIDLKTAKEKIPYYFGGIPKGKKSDKIESWVTTLSSDIEESFNADVEASSFYFSWPSPNRSDKDNDLLSIGVDILAGTENSYLNELFIDKLNLMTSISQHINVNRNSGYITIGGTIKEGGNINDIAQQFEFELNKFLNGKIDEKKLKLFKSQEKMKLLKFKEHSANLGQELGNSETMYNNAVLPIESYNNKINASPKEIISTMRNWLSKNRYLALIHRNTKNADEFADKVDRTKKPDLIFNEKVDVLPVETVSLSNGIELSVITRTDNQLVSGELSFDFGKLSTEQGKPGVANLALSLLTKGSQKHKYADLMADMRKLGLSIGTDYNSDKTTISFNALSPNLKDSIALLSEVITTPAFPEEQLEKEKEQMRNEFISMENTPQRASEHIVNTILFGPDNALARQQSIENISSINNVDLFKFHSSNIRPDNVKIRLVGDIDINTAKNILEEHFASWNVDKNPIKSKFESAYQSDLENKIILINDPDAQQTQITAVIDAGKYLHEEEESLDAIGSILGGSMTSRINSNLRLDKGWTYGARGGFFNDPMTPVIFKVKTTVQKDKTTESIVEISNEIKKMLSTKPITEKELSDYITNATKSNSSKYETNSSWLYVLRYADRFGVDYKKLVDNSAEIKSLNVNSLNKLAKSKLDNKSISWIIVGDINELKTKMQNLNFGRVYTSDTNGNIKPIN
ncbi:M16 family metallopeptidase [Shewanella sp. GXUN23E]|uniref:M16 family metallopeptidase n=1 Tax=Shewanella sp. GXUN23E TaxID=3422498 RepID=UPI003D7C7443